MTFEQRVEGALHSVDGFLPSPDLFAKVRRSIQEDLAYRSRVRRVLGAAGGTVAAVLVYLLFTVDVVEGVWTMSFAAFEILVTLAMIGIVIVLGPAIRRFGETFQQDIFRGSDNGTGTHVLRLLDIAYYLIFGAYVLMTMEYAAPREHGLMLVGWLQEGVLFRVAGLLMLMGALHVALLLALPVVGLVFAANNRKTRILAGTPSADTGLDKVDMGITVAIWLLAIGGAFPLLLAVLGFLGGD